MTQAKVNDVAKRLHEFAVEQAQKNNIPFDQRHDFIYDLATGVATQIGLLNTEIKKDMNEQETLFCADVYVLCKRLKRRLELMKSKNDD
jgi:hypothetical protein